jgi:eukaryotic-like serine/threonine-protein kinase
VAANEKLVHGQPKPRAWRAVVAGVGHPALSSAASRLPDDENIVGRLVANRYLIEETCERSPRSVIYRAHHLVTDRSVLLRIFEERSGVTRDVCRDALAFAERAAGLPSPHVARTLDVGVVSERWPFIVSEYSRGKSLAAVLEQGRPLPLGRILPVARQLANVLSMAHMARMVHGELQLAGIWVESPSGRPEWVRLLDFGLSELPPAGFASSQSGVFPSSARRPGIADGFSPAAVFADIQALGATLYQLASGSPVNWAERDVAAGLDVRFAGAGWTGERALLRGFSRIVERCLGLVPESHYRSMEELAYNLDSLTETAQAIGAPTEPSSPTVSAVHAPPRRAQVVLGGPKVIVQD